MPRRIALVLYDPDRVNQVSLQAEAYAFAAIFHDALRGYRYRAERGIIKITLLDEAEPADHPCDPSLRKGWRPG